MAIVKGRLFLLLVLLAGALAACAGQDPAPTTEVLAIETVASTSAAMPTADSSAAGARGQTR